MRRAKWKPKYPDEPGDDVFHIPGTGGRYGVTANGNVYRVNEEEILSEEHFPPLKPERPTSRRELARVRVRLDGDPPQPRSAHYHTVAWLVFHTLRPGEYPDYETGKWSLYNINHDPMDNHIGNIGIREGSPRVRRTRLKKSEESMAKVLLRKGRWTPEQIASAFRVKVKVIKRIESTLE